MIMEMLGLLLALKLAGLPVHSIKVSVEDFIPNLVISLLVYHNSEALARKSHQIQAGTMLTSSALLALVVFWTVCLAVPGRERQNGSPFARVLAARQSDGSADSSLRIDLGYGVYEGYLNSTSNLKTWKG